jgi:hypothetical protein
VLFLFLLRGWRFNDADQLELLFRFKQSMLNESAGINYCTHVPVKHGKQVLLQNAKKRLYSTVKAETVNSLRLVSDFRWGVQRGRSALWL